MMRFPIPKQTAHRSQWEGASGEVAKPGCRLKAAPVFSCASGLGGNLAVKVRFWARQWEPLADGQGFRCEAETV